MGATPWCCRPGSGVRAEVGARVRVRVRARARARPMHEGYDQG